MVPPSWVSERRNDPRSLAAYRVASAMRRINNHLHATSADPGDLSDLAERLEGVAVAAEALPPGGSFWDHLKTDASGEVGEFGDVSPVGGRANVIASPLEIVVAPDGSVRAEAEFGWAYEGPPGHVHGGIVAAAFDEVLGVTQAMGGWAGMTGTLSVKYHRPTALHRRLVFEAWVDRKQGRRVYASAKLTADGEHLASAEALFITVDFEQIRV